MTFHVQESYVNISAQQNVFEIALFLRIYPSE